MKNDELKNLLCEFIHDEMKKPELTLPRSRPGAYTTSVNKKTIGEAVYQRSIISSGSHSLNSLGQVMWLDIELPVVFGISSRRSCVDLVGKDQNKRFVLCELKYEKPEKDHKPKQKPSSDSPAYALCELIGYYLHTVDNAERLQEDGIWHTNSAGKLDWTLCKDSKNVVLVVAANDTYWERWRNYNPKNGKNGWAAQAKDIKDIIDRFQGELSIKFYSTPHQEENFTVQAKASANAGCTRYTPKSLKGDWKEIEIISKQEKDKQC